MMTNIASNFDFNSVLIYCGLCLLFEFICLDFFPFSTHSQIVFIWWGFINLDTNNLDNFPHPKGKGIYL